MKEQTIDYSKKWYAMAAVGLGVFLAVIDGSIVNIALPTLVRTLKTEFAVIQWVVLVYLLTVTTLTISIGRLADIIGKKPLYTAGFIIFITGSALCGLSPTVGWLIGARVVQALGAALIMALGAAIITEAFPGTERGKAIGIIGAVVSIGAATGPSIGGVILKFLSWQWIFYVNIPTGVIGAIMVGKFVPALKPKGGQKFDYWGAVTMFLGLLVLLSGLTAGQRMGFSKPMVWLFFAGFLVFLALFILIEKRTAQPMVPPSFFNNNLFTTSLVNGYLVFACLGCTSILVPFYLMNVLGYDHLQVGVLMCFVPISLGIVSPISGSLSDRFGSRPVSLSGLLVLVGGFISASTLSVETTAVGYVLRMLPIGIGMGIFQSPNNSAIMGALPRRHLGVASGMLSITRTLGQTSGVSVFGAIWATLTLMFANSGFSGGTTEAPGFAQVAALQYVFRQAFMLIAISFIVSAWNWWKRRK